MSEFHPQFAFFRVDISDTLMYVYEMLGVELLSNLYDRLGRQLMDPQLSAVWQVSGRRCAILIAMHCGIHPVDKLVKWDVSGFGHQCKLA